MTDHARLLQAVALEPWSSLLVLADACEEAGDTRRAAGYRWLAKLRKFPAGDRGLWWWMNQRTAWNSSEPLPADTVGSASSRLPNAVGNLLRLRSSGRIGLKDGEFHELAHCWDEGAYCVGCWLEAEAIRGQGNG